MFCLRSLDVKSSAFIAPTLYKSIHQLSGLMTFVGEKKRVVAHLDQVHFKQSFKSLGLTGVNFVRMPLISRSAQRRRIAVSKSNAAHGELVCSAIPCEANVGRSSTRVALASSTAGSLTTASDAAF